MEGLPRPRRWFRTPGTTVATGKVRSPCITDYAYGLVLERGYLSVWQRPGLSSSARMTLADLLESEAALLRQEAEAIESRGLRSLLRRVGGK